jgi:hypothetical protein
VCKNGWKRFFRIYIQVFSRTKPTDALLDTWFKTRTETHYKEWRAYPVLTPVDRKLWPPFRLGAPLLPFCIRTMVFSTQPAGPLISLFIQ